MSKKDKGGEQEPQGAQIEQPPAPKFVRVRPGFVVLYPFIGDYVARGVAGDVLLANDPLLDTRKMPREFLDKYELQAVETLFRIEPAPDATAITVKTNKRAAAIYRALGFDGYRTKDDIEAEAKAAKYDPKPASVRTAAESVTADDLDVPARDPVPHKS